MVEQVRPDLIEHARLIGDFVDNRIPASEFETRYLRLVKNDLVIHGEPAFGIIDELFFHVDEYFDDPDFTEAERREEDENLRNFAKIALDKLIRLNT